MMSSPSFSLPLPGRAGRAVEYLRELWRRREFAIALGLGNFKARNASTSLGLLWWVLNPLLLGAVYYLLFGLIFPGRRGENFLSYLLSGMFVFHFTGQSLTGGANSIISNAKLLANLRFPRLILPVSSLIESTIGFLGSLVVLITISSFAGEMVWTHRLLYLPFIIGIQLLFNLGLGALSARLAVPFRDVNNVVPYLNRLWLYLSPVIWPLAMLEEASETMNLLVRLNPMFFIIRLYRSSILGSPIILDDILISGLVSLGVALIGVTVFVKYEGHIVRYL